MPAGRPTKYNGEVLKVTKEYIDNYATHGDMMPSVAGLAVLLGIRRETLHVWAKEEGKEIFSNMLGDLQAKQEQVLFNNGLNGTFNSTITKLALTKHGYHDKVDSEQSGPDGGAIEHKWTVEVVEAKGGI